MSVTSRCQLRLRWRQIHTNQCTINGHASKLFDNITVTQLSNSARTCLTKEFCFFSLLTNRRNYSTIDHIFTLLALVQRQLHNHNTFYVAFIDFKKALDLVDRSCLWAVLRKNGIRGKMYWAIQSMYDVVKTRVRAGGDLKPVLNWANVCSRTQLEVFGEPSWFLIGRTFATRT